MPTFHSLERATKRAQDALAPFADEPEVARLKKLLEGSVKQVKMWCRRYVQSILVFRNAQRAMRRLDGSKQAEAFYKADMDRRRIHDALLSSVATINNLLHKAEEYAEFEMPLAWMEGTPIPSRFAAEHALIFSPQAIENRKLIRDWSIAADRIEQIRQTTGISEPFSP